ncbi:hypothetical protein Mgra_00005004 [Meloidogyne graminicola]|uniref:DH domain-containing protein n=1 Tax=Meloidogyne graminicola TaxID=189291 RepID=A0A8S9ZQ82_9BILA|nr:hypothetical protein Mgra_00005004 [Meloidogyne graminicola]
MSSFISNPFFNYSTNNILSTSSNNSKQIPPFLTPPNFRRAAVTDGNKFKKENEEIIKQEEEESEHFFVENPFTQDDCNNGGNIEFFDSRMSQSSSAVVDSIFSEGSTVVPGISNVKMLQDSGYRSTILNSNLEDEIAFAEKEKHEEREQRRKQRRKGHHQKIKREERMTGPTNNNNKNNNSSSSSSSVPAFLRRTCSNAANGISSIKPSEWIEAALMKVSTSDDNVKRGKSIPRRTQSIGSSILPSTLPPSFLYSTGWMVEADLSSDDSIGDKHENNNGNEDCIIELDGQRKLAIQRLHELLLSQFCFISGMKTCKGHPLLTFPDSRCYLSFENYQLLLDYLFQINREESDLLELDNNNKTTTIKSEWIVLIDRRQDRWSSVKTILSFLMNYFPEPIYLIILLKPEGVLQRAIEYGYKSLLDGCEKFRINVCQSCTTLYELIDPELLTMDLGGSVQHNHKEWTTYRIEIERMKSSARIIAESLGDFGKCLRETELPNDVQTTEKVLEVQQHERDAIKEDFRISIRKGLQLLRQAKQQIINNDVNDNESIEKYSPSPCTLQNIAAIERMIAQLQDTEKSFDNFWQKHRLRLINCLELRRFEDEFRKLQNCFAKHLSLLEENKGNIGNSESSAIRLILENKEYKSDAMADVFAARTLKERGLILAKKELTESLNTQGSDSVGPKCEELIRMANALEHALEIRSKALELSRQMHSQIGKLNTERSYVRELAEIIHYYIQPFEALEFNGTNSHILPISGQSSDVLFGNIRELHNFHNSILLPALHQNSNSVQGVSTVLSSQRHKLLTLYRIYCRNKPISEELRAEHSLDQNKFILECQRRAGHLLPLSSYLLKPIQRITKYQLLLKELIKHCPDAGNSLQHVQLALTSMLDLLAQINADMEQLHILGYPGDLRLLGSLKLRTECDVSVYKRAKSASAGGLNSGRRNGIRGKQQRRHLTRPQSWTTTSSSEDGILPTAGQIFNKKETSAANSNRSSTSSSSSAIIFDSPTTKI